MHPIIVDQRGLILGLVKMGDWSAARRLGSYGVATSISPSASRHRLNWSHPRGLNKRCLRPGRWLPKGRVSCAK